MFVPYKHIQPNLIYSPARVATTLYVGRAEALMETLGATEGVNPRKPLQPNHVWEWEHISEMIFNLKNNICKLY